MTGYVDPQALERISEFISPIKARAFEVLHVAPGDRVLDVGCGHGLDTVRLASSVAPGGHVIGIDSDPSMIARATAHAPPAPLLAPMHLVANALALPFREGAFDRCRCERVLQHVRHPGQVVVEMFRVLRPGGIAVLADTDWASLSIDCRDDELERRVVRAVADSLASPYAGRQIGRLMRHAGFTSVRIDACPVSWTSYDSFRQTSFPAAGIVPHLISSGSLTGAEWKRFVDDVEHEDAPSAFFASATIFIGVGTK